MNYKMVAHTLGTVLLAYAGLLLLPLVTGIIFGENVLSFAAAAALSAGLGLLLRSFKIKSRAIYAEEGFVSVGLAWILMSLIGAIPFVIGGDIPKYVDAVFETASGLSTTGASVVTNIEGMTKSGLFWRSFTHWIGGMGMLVFIMAVMPKGDEHSMHIMRAEVPGPVVSKLVPKVRSTAVILYLIYTALTVLETIFLMLGGMSFFESLLQAFSTAGTGGFCTRSAGVLDFGSAYIEVVLSIFMMLFGVNFNLYFLILIGRAKEAFKNEELHWYLAILATATLAIAVGIRDSCGSFGAAVRTAFFNVNAIVSTTGYTHSDFTQWPAYTQAIIVALMFVGGCAGSTGGGMKLSRIMLLIKSAKADVIGVIHPRRVTRPRLEGKCVDSGTVRAVYSYAVLFMLVLLLSTLIVSFDGYDFGTCFTASLSCLSNVGPGLNLVGPMGSYNIFSDGIKAWMSLLMIFGRLEMYPILMLFVPATWKRKKSAE